jgi:hypothetical protein
MKAITLTAPQQTQAATNKAAVTAARAALVAAVSTQNAYLQTAVGLPATAKVQLSDDGTMVITG